MSLNQFAYIILFSILAVLLMWVFNSTVFSQCYLEHRMILGANLLPELNLSNCLIITGSIVLLMLIFIPLLLISIIHLILKLSRVNPNISAYILWGIWLGVLYYCNFMLTFIVTV